MIKKLILASLVNVSLFAMGGPSLVETAKLVKGNVNPLQQFVGTIEFDKKSVLAAQNSGVIKSMKFELGDTIKKGKMLVQIDADLLNAQIKAANASLANAKEELKNANKNYERYKKLLTSKSITQKLTVETLSFAQLKAFQLLTRYGVNIPLVLDMVAKVQSSEIIGFQSWYFEEVIQIFELF